MTKWLITFSLPSDSRWHFVEFGGATGSEARGIVDFIAIRKDHRYESGTLRRGDALDIVLVQVKGGSARQPTIEDNRRLHAVARRHKARAIVLAEWKRGSRPVLYELRHGRWDRDNPIVPGQFFR
jgi:hypothetical protein